MRPIKITMSAFGPYSGRTVLDLDSLGNSGLYLITGDTGAGKTTIFDAISYSLFGDASGENREPSMFRSKYAAYDTPTEVELVFEYGNKIYTVKRSPEYERAKARVEGTTTKKAEAELYLPDGRVITKQREVDAEIEEIIGINREQFLQIAMIAQGDFLKLLLAPTEDRKKIFRKIFKTEPYRKLQDDLKSEASELNKKCETVKDGIRIYINEIKTPDVEELKLEAAKAKNGDMPLSEIFLLLEKLISEDETEEEAILKTTDEAEKVLEEANKKLGVVKVLEDNERELAALKESLGKAEEECMVKSAILEKEKDRTPEIEQAAKEMTTAEAELPRYDNFEKLAVKAAVSEKELSDKQKIREKRTVEFSEKSAALETLKSELEGLSDVEEIGRKILYEIEKTKDRKDKIDALGKAIEDCDRQNKKLQTSREDYVELSERCKKLKAEYERKNQAFLDEQAGILAERLTEGVPCPVCGAVEHPSPAEKSTEAPTKEELKKLREKCEELEKSASKMSETCAAIKATVEANGISIRKSISELFGETDFERASDTVAEEAKKLSDREISLSKQLEKEKQRSDKKASLQKKLPLLDAELLDIKAETDCLNQDIAALEATVDIEREQLKSEKANLKFDGKHFAQAEIERLKSFIETVKCSVETAEKNHNAADRKVGELKAAIKEREETLKNAEKLDKAEIIATVEKYDEINGYAKEKAKNVHSRLDTNKSAYENLKAKSADLERLESRYQSVNALSNTANGNIRGKEKIMLETYIQTTFFDRIISRANLRFMVMSGGQYELKRRIEAENNRSQCGLDLDVIDHYNGSERSVKTLSGGESFKASLSLALGLSDEIQSSSGGVKIDTMFVDEGFGSLDEESLEQAMKALTGLADGNRLVGIISHVAELKTRIDKQIVVTKDRDGGSSAKIVL